MQQYWYITGQINTVYLQLLQRVCFICKYVICSDLLCIRWIIELSLYSFNIEKIISCVFFFSLLLSLQAQVNIFLIFPKLAREEGILEKWFLPVSQLAIWGYRLLLGSVTVLVEGVAAGGVAAVGLRLKHSTQREGAVRWQLGDTPLLSGPMLNSIKNKSSKESRIFSPHWIAKNEGFHDFCFQSWLFSDVPVSQSYWLSRVSRSVNYEYLWVFCSFWYRCT